VLASRPGTGTSESLLSKFTILAQAFSYAAHYSYVKQEM